jgi:hypothetical protein
MGVHTYELCARAMGAVAAMAAATPPCGRQHRCVVCGVCKYIDIGVGCDDDRRISRKCKGGNKIISPRTK